MEFVLGRILLRHDLNEQCPTGKIALLDAVVQVALVAFPALADDLLGLFIGQILDPLLGTEMKFYPVTLVPGVDEAEGVAAETVHVAVGGRDAPIAHDDGYLVQRFGERGPEIPVIESAPQVGAGVAFHGVVQVRKLERVTQEEDRRVVSDQIPIPLLGVELDCETADVALGVGRAAFAGNSGEAHEAGRLLADLGEDLRFRVTGDVAGHGERAEGTGALGVHAAFGNDLAVEVCELFQVPGVLQQHGPTWAGGHRILVVVHGCSGNGRQQFLLLLVHHRSPFVRILSGMHARFPLRVHEALQSV